MENQQNIAKGELMEELLRNYFIDSGYYVVRGIKYRYEGNDITDVDLYLYGRSSSITRQRLNVDIKNKKTPQAFERILWANGLQKLLGFDGCIVATTDQRPLLQKFGILHNTIILDGSFLSKMRSNSYPDRLTEEELTIELSKYKSNKTFINKDWRAIYEESKSRLLSELDFSGFNLGLTVLRYFFEKVITDFQKREAAVRMTYLVISHLLITMDYIIKDVAFLATSEKENKLLEGFKFGNLGKVGVDKIINVAVQISNGKSAYSFLKTFENIPTDILKDFFSKNENTKNLFIWAKDLERIGFNRNFINPENLETSLKGIVSVLLDYNGIERRKFFSLFTKDSQINPNVESNIKEDNETKTQTKSN